MDDLFVSATKRAKMLSAHQTLVNMRCNTDYSNTTKHLTLITENSFKWNVLNLPSLLW